MRLAPLRARVPRRTASRLRPIGRCSSRARPMSERRRSAGPSRRRWRVHREEAERDCRSRHPRRQCARVHVKTMDPPRREDSRCDCRSRVAQAQDASAFRWRSIYAGESITRRRSNCLPARVSRGKRLRKDVPARSAGQMSYRVVRLALAQSRPRRRRRAGPDRRAWPSPGVPARPGALSGLPRHRRHR